MVRSATVLFKEQHRTKRNKKWCENGDVFEPFICVLPHTTFRQCYTTRRLSRHYELFHSLNILIPFRVLSKTLAFKVCSIRKKVEAQSQLNGNTSRSPATGSLLPPCAGRVPQNRPALQPAAF